MKKILGLVTVIFAVGGNVVPHSISIAGASDKVVVCHKGKTLLIPQAAVQAHVDHGDTRGACTVTECHNR